MKYFSLGLIIVLICLISFGDAKLNRLKSTKRAITGEEVAFQLIYLGSCSKFFSIPSFIITRKDPASNCLPISSTAPYLDSSTLTADVICTDIGTNRAQIDFVEIYQAPDHDIPVTDFIMIFASNAPYKAARSNVNYLRRPSCEIDEDYCSTTDYVKSCTENHVELSNGYVVSKDTVYIIPEGASYVGCSLAENSCCSYVTPGFCPRQANNSVFRIKFNGRPNQDRPPQGRPSYRPGNQRPDGIHHNRPGNQRPPNHRPNYRPGDHHDDDEDDDHRHHDNDKKLESQQPQQKTEQKQVVFEVEKPSANTAPSRGKHQVKTQQQEKLAPLIPLREMPAEEKPLIPLRVIDVHAAKNIMDDDEDDKKKK